MMSVTVLGTSSAVPQYHRNLSATILKYQSDLILFDCGEATQFHLKKAGLSPSKIKVICITHLHGDHTFGLLGLISSLDHPEHHQPLHIFSPPGLKEIYEVSVRNQQFFVEFPIVFHELENLDLPNIIFESHLYFISAISLDHRIPSIGFRFQEKEKPGHLIMEKVEQLQIPQTYMLAELKKGHSVTLEDGRIIFPNQVLGDPIKGHSFCYITDTRFTERSILLAKDADVMMHESTFLSDLEVKAKETGHSTAKQAATVAKEAKVGELVLFHFSARYPKAEPLVEEAKSIFEFTRAAKEFEEFFIGLKV